VKSRTLLSGKQVKYDKIYPPFHRFIGSQLYGFALDD
jgi:hypothetical protein